MARDPNVGVTLIEVDDGGKWRLGLGNEGWNLKVGATVPVRYRFDESRWWHATAVAVKSRLYIIPLDADREAVDGFRHGREMQIHYGERSLSMDLTGSSQLLFDLADCVKRYRDGS